MYIRKLRNKIGMFSNVNNVLRHCIYEDKYNCPRFYIEWYNEFYQNKKYNLWEKYFEQPYFNKEYKEFNYSTTKLLPKIRQEYPRYIMPYKNGITYPPIDKLYINSIIKKRIIFKKFLIEKKNDFLKKFKDKYLIGLHIRGSGMIHCGTPKYRINFELINNIPLKEYIYHLNKKIKLLKEKNIDYEILLFTDNNFVLNYFKEIFPVKYYDANRIDDSYGEIHMYNKDESIKDKLAEDILIETLIMSELNFFIHGLSNISNFVLCNNPNLKSINIFNKFFISL